MLASEITALCTEAAQSTGLPVDWVLHHVHSLAGHPCPRCGGSGIVLPGACFRCEGTGGRASHVGVLLALNWVRSNTELVRSLGEKRALRATRTALEHLQETLLKVETWKRDHADLWDFLDGMEDGEFKRSLVQAVEAGRLSENQEEALHKMVLAKKQREQTPLVGARVDVPGLVAVARHTVDAQGHRVFRVEIDTLAGWRGRVDTTCSAIVDRVQGRSHDRVIVRGSVVWRREGFVILAKQSEILSDG